ncbi:MAG: hypothetical protein A2X64_02925 [Ignavibacteria bacterium GWF2_33_9]|nr:MAG: hypothetical protein A2X64_02925 [Ignavibacteria bacterium GWF2_33_9]
MENNETKPELEKLLQEMLKQLELAPPEKGEQILLDIFDNLVNEINGNPDLIKDRPPLPDKINRFALRMALIIYAQAYYKIMEVVSSAPVGYADFVLNNFYLQVVKKIRYILSTDEFKDFTGDFNPPDHVLPSSELGIIGWEDGVSQEVEGFVASVQTFFNEMDFYGKEPPEVSIIRKWLLKMMEPIFKHIEEYRQKTNQYFNSLLKKVEKDKAKIEKKTSESAHNPQKLPCSQAEYKHFTTIHTRLKDLMKLLRATERDYEKIQFMQVELDEDITAFWPIMENIGQNVQIVLSGKLEILQNIINDIEIENPYTVMEPPFTIDGKDFDEIQAVEMAEKYFEEKMQPRYELIAALDRILVRLNKSFITASNSEINSAVTKKNITPSETQDQSICLKDFIKRYCDLSEKPDIDSKCEMLMREHRRKAIALPLVPMQYRRGQRKLYYTDKLHNSWPMYRKTLTSLPPLKKSGNK